MTFLTLLCSLSYMHVQDLQPCGVLLKEKNLEGLGSHSNVGLKEQISAFKGLHQLIDGHCDLFYAEPTALIFTLACSPLLQTSITKPEGAVFTSSH